MYAQIGGLSVATFITLLLVPGDLRDLRARSELVKWDKEIDKPPHLIAEPAKRAEA